MSTAARLNVEFSSSGVSGVKNDITGVGNALDSANGKSGNFFQNMMSTAGGFIIAQGFNSLKNNIIGVGSSIIDANSNMEMWTMQLQVSTGSIEGANAVLDNMKDMAKVSPFDLPELIQGANALESLGFSSQKWMPIIGDTAAATGKSIDQVTQAVMDASTGEFERLKELGIRTKVNGDMIQFSFMKNGQMMTIEAENTAEGIENALYGIWDDKYTGAMATMSDTWVGRMGNLKDTVNMALMDFGKPLFDFMKEGVTGVTKFLETFMRRIDQGQGVVHSLLWSIPETLRNLGLGDLATKIVPVIKGIEKAWNSVGRVGRVVGRIIKSTLGAAFKILADNMDIVRAVGKSLLTVMGGMLAWSAITGVVSFLGAVLVALLSPIGLLIAGVAALYLAWDNNWLGIRDAASAAWDFLEPIFDWIVQAVREVIAVFDMADAMGMNGWAAAWDMIKVKAGEAIDQITSFLSDIDWGAAWGAMSAAAGGAWDAIRSGASSAWDWLSGLDWGGLVLGTWDVLSNAGTWIAEKLGSAVSAITTWVTDQFEGVDWPTAIQTGIDTLATAIGTGVSGMVSISTKILDWMTTQVTGVSWSSVGQKFGELLGIALKAAIGLILLSGKLFLRILDEIAAIDYDTLAQSLWEFLKAAALAAIDLLVGIGQGLWDSLSEELGTLDWDAVWDVVFAPFMSLVDAATEAWNTFTGLFGTGEGADMEAVDAEKKKRNPSAYNAEQRQNLLSSTTSSGLTVGDVVDNTSWMAQVAALQAVKSAADDATPSVGIFNDALQALSPTSQQSTIDMNLMASTAPIMGTSMDTANTQVKGAGAGISSTLSGIAAATLTHLSTARSTAVSQFAAMSSGTLASALGMQAGVAARMATLASSVTTQSSNARNNAVSAFSAMNTNATAKFMGMQASAAVQMALMASTATTKGNSTMSNLVGAIAGGMARVTGALLALPRAVSSVGGSAASTAYSIGANISSSFASGMWAFMGQIAAAAAQMVATADAALRAKARIASPSKVFQALGGYVGEGFELGIRNSIPDIARAADAMLGTGMPSSAFSAPFSGGGYGGGTTVIDNTTHNETFITLNDAQFAELLAAKDKANAMYRHATSRRNPARYEG